MLKGKIIRELLISEIKTSADLESFKRGISRKYQIPCLTNIELLKAYHRYLENKTIKKSDFLKNLLKTRPVRSLSGIVNISVLTKPYPCPGKCLFCPIEKGIPKSYVSGEPAVERAKKLHYDPYLQVKKRIEMLEMEGHPTDKIELRVVGGTWSFYPKEYQEKFIGNCFRAANEPHNSIIRSNFKIKPLKELENENAKAKHRIVGLSVETRPDFINLEEIHSLRNLGVTMVEMGVQSTYDDVLKFNLRGHTVKETIVATKLLKDAGFKVLYQMMPNLPKSSLARDKKIFEEIFTNPNFRPDMLKIYPCALLKEAPLYKLWQTGKYKPYTEKQLIDLVSSIKRYVPSYVRIQRISRDIPSSVIVAGPAKISNLRQLLSEKMQKENWRCKCIRCREVKNNYDPKEKIYLFRQNYQASEGKEVFLSFENKNRTKLYSLLRLRIPGHWKTGHCNSLPILKNAAIIREIHTYGQLHSIGQEVIQRNSAQHKGMGKRLIKEAEKISKKEFKLNRIAVISGIGVRNYFSKLKYRLKETYMIKDL
ncbi:MAG: tRNA uridine(34) 5-carboxymethylaminomethyl modification radical SAM/GNAT enzyme Elp3 [bacterium]|nr:tRNA uridine(34) 5-carboxymethylaminomethyl modification radical SAM/GNAT enzyme Elp3 [bacterium]